MCKREKAIIEAIKHAVADQFGVTVDDIHSRSTNHTVSRARLVAMALVRGATLLTYREIAVVFNRASIFSPRQAPGRIRVLCEDADFDRMYRHLEKQFGVA